MFHLGVNILNIKVTRMFNFYLSIIISEYKSMMALKYYFKYNSFMRKNAAELFLNDYDVTNTFDNDRSTIMFRN